MADIPDVTLDTFERDVLKADGPTLVYFYATWCKPCQELTEDLQAVADEVAERVKVVQVNTDRQGDIVRKQRVRTIPTLQLVHDGRTVTTIQGRPSRVELMGKLSAFVDDTSGGDEEAVEEGEEET